MYAGGGAKEVLDPHVQSLFVDIARHKAIYEKLVELGPDLKPVPRLAAKWEPDAQADDLAVHPARRDLPRRRRS